MAEVRLQIANREYIVTCRDGEENRLIELGAMVDAKANEAGGSAAGLNESRLLLFAALLLADEASASNANITNGNSTSPQGDPDPQSTKDIEIAAQTIEKLAERVENLAQSLEQSIK